MSVIPKVLQLIDQERAWTFQDLACGFFVGEKIGRVLRDPKVMSNLWGWAWITFDSYRLYRYVQGLKFVQAHPNLARATPYAGLVIAGLNFVYAYQGEDNSTSWLTSIWRGTQKVNAILPAVNMIHQARERPIPVAIACVAALFNSEKDSDTWVDKCSRIFSASVFCFADGGLFRKRPSLDFDVIVATAGKVKDVVSVLLFESL